MARKPRYAVDLDAVPARLYRSTILPPDPNDPEAVRAAALWHRAKAAQDARDAREQEAEAHIRANVNGMRLAREHREEIMARRAKDPAAWAVKLKRDAQRLADWSAHGPAWRSRALWRWDKAEARRQRKRRERDAAERAARVHVVFDAPLLWAAVEARDRTRQAKQRVMTGAWAHRAHLGRIADNLAYRERVEAVQELNKRRMSIKARVLRGAGETMRQRLDLERNEALCAEEARHSRERSQYFAFYTQPEYDAPYRLAKHSELGYDIPEASIIETLEAIAWPIILDELTTGYAPPFRPQGGRDGRA
jgi:hypothetical protein